MTGMPMIITKGLLAAMSAAAIAAAQNAPRQLTARELYYAAAQAPAPRTSSAPKAPVKTAQQTPKAPPKPVEIARNNDPAPVVRTTTPAAAPQTAPMPASGEPPLGIRYTILKVNNDNSTTEVTSETVFHSGDRIRFSIEPNTAGYLYIVNQGSSGTWKPMFPSPEIDDGNNKVEGFRPYTMPPKSRLVFDSNPGTENLFIVFSRQPEPDLEQMIYSLQGGKRAAKTVEEPPRMDKNLIMAVNIGNPMVERLRNAYGRDLIVEKVDPTTPGDRKETATYVVNPSGSTDSRVVADLHLVHR
jgi:hypothetical protein